MLNTARTVAKRWRREGKFPGLVRAGACGYRCWKNTRTLIKMPAALSQMRATREVEDPDRLIELAFHGFGGTIRPIQIPSEIRSLLHVVRELKPVRLMEIGTANGGTLFLLAKAAAPNAHIISVDMPGGWFGGGYPRFKARLFKAFTHASQRLDLIRADSHVSSTVDSVRQLLSGQPLDFLLIDGDHTYEGVKQDFETYSPLVRPGGLVAFHDIMSNPFESSSQVHVFWNEVKQNHRADEFVADRSQAGLGIGALWM